MAHRRTLSKQSLQGQVSIKFTPEICINKASSNSRLTHWAGKPQPQIPFSELSPDSFFFPLSLPLMREQPNYTCMLKNLLKLYCILTWDTLGSFFFILFCKLLFYFGFSRLLPLWWDSHRTISEAPYPEMDGEGQTPKLLRLKRYWIWTWRFYICIYCIYWFIYFYLFIYYYLLFFIFNPLSFSLMPVQLTVA
jgi:hypothetical protein